MTLCASSPKCVARPGRAHPKTHISSRGRGEGWSPFLFHQHPSANNAHNEDRVPYTFSREDKFVDSVLMLAANDTVISARAKLSRSCLTRSSSFKQSTAYTSTQNSRFRVHTCRIAASGARGCAPRGWGRAYAELTNTVKGFAYMTRGQRNNRSIQKRKSTSTALSSPPP